MRVRIAVFKSNAVSTMSEICSFISDILQALCLKSVYKFQVKDGFYISYKFLIRFTLDFIFVDNENDSHY